MMQTRCTSESGSGSDDAGAEVRYNGGDEYFEAQIPSFSVPSAIAVVQGETTIIPIQWSGPHVTFGVVNLPTGVTAGALTADGLPLTADANAPIAKATATITSDSISRDITVYVTGRAGSLDPAFGIGGIDSAAGTVRGISIMSDGRVIAAIEYYSSVVVNRYMPNGSADMTFGQSGRVTVGPGYARAVAVAPDGEIAIASVPQGGVHVYVLAADGTLARTIDRPGNASNAAWYTVMWSGTNIVVIDPFRTNTIDPNNQIVTAGVPQDAPYWNAFPTSSDRVLMAGQLSSQPTLTRILPTQGVYSVDTTYGNGGTVTFADLLAQGTSLVTTPNDALFLQVSGQSGSDIVRLASDGSLDTTWGTQGHVSVTQAAGPLVYLPASNALLATGESNGTVVERFLSNGTLDSNFGYMGAVTTAMTSVPCAAAVDPSETVLYLGGSNFLLRYRIHP